MSNRRWVREERRGEGGRRNVRMLVSIFLQRSPLFLFLPILFFSPSLSQIFTFRAVLTFHSFLSCCFATFKGSLFRHESTARVPFARIRDLDSFHSENLLLFIFIPSLFPHPRFPLSPAFPLSFFFFFFFFSNIRAFRSFRISRFYSSNDIRTCFTRTN